MTEHTATRTITAANPNIQSIHEAARLAKDGVDVMESNGRSTGA
jgi:hypothetical protein